MSTLKFHHVSGIDGLFIKLEGRSNWLPVNDAEWQPTTAGAFIFRPEQYYVLTNEAPPATLNDDKILHFGAEAETIESCRLDMLALVELSKDLRSAEAECNLEALIEAFNHSLKQDHLYP